MYYLKFQLVLDLAEENSIPISQTLTEMLDMQIKNPYPRSFKEYCFIYPILSSKKEKLLDMFRYKSNYFSQEIQDVYRYRGISKTQLWIQETAEAPYLLIYQQISGPVLHARKKYLQSKSDEFSRARAEEFSEITGLTYEELLPALESLFDGEVLQD